MKLFHWGLMLRYMIYGVLPLLILFVVIERRFGPGDSSVALLLLAGLLPFIAIGWLAYQHYRHRKR